MKKTLVTIALPLAALTLAACGGTSGTSGTSAAESATAGADSPANSPAGSPAGSTADMEVNDADVAFVQGMIPHHQQALEMATLARSRAEAAPVRALAGRIEQAQGPEIETMTGWLEEWDRPLPSMAGDGAMAGMDHGQSSGMMDQGDLDRLRSATGARFDELFLTMMVEHHRGAIETARAEQADGQAPEVVALAASIADAQTKEIAEMRRLLAS